jgi:hypothetical protein
VSYTRFRNVDFGLVKYHIPYLSDLTLEQLVEAVEKFKESTSVDRYRPPELDKVVPYLTEEASHDKQQLLERLNQATLKGINGQLSRSQKMEARRRNRASRRQRRNSR